MGGTSYVDPKNKENESPATEPPKEDPDKTQPSIPTPDPEPVT